eukprot:TRINITY_DN1622_c0_g1_i2.p1 TRINITY_DN1622_c0_g1~~TRINITY_DN1622_c0_g1_i2.p1  ORF type:complete len:756 (-),score=194.33 TRINITY_DN1622_c0_g1_i2:48-2315(-)
MAQASPWITAVDPNSGVTYYYNTVTAESSWTNPLATDDASMPEPPTNLNESPDDWVPVVDTASGATYYFNTVTKLSSWDMPMGFEMRSKTMTTNADGTAKRAPPAQGMIKVYFLNGNTKMFQIKPETTVKEFAEQIHTKEMRTDEVTRYRIVTIMKHDIGKLREYESRVRAKEEEKSKIEGRLRDFATMYISRPDLKDEEESNLTTCRLTITQLLEDLRPLVLPLFFGEKVQGMKETLLRQSTNPSLTTQTSSGSMRLSAQDDKKKRQISMSFGFGKEKERRDSGAPATPPTTKEKDKDKDKERERDHLLDETNERVFLFHDVTLLLRYHLVAEPTIAMQPSAPPAAGSGSSSSANAAAAAPPPLSSSSSVPGVLSGLMTSSTGSFLPPSSPFATLPPAGGPPPLDASRPASTSFGSMSSLAAALPPLAVPEIAPDSTRLISEGPIGDILKQAKAKEVSKDMFPVKVHTVDATVFSLFCDPSTSIALLFLNAMDKAKLPEGLIHEYGLFEIYENDIEILRKLEEMVEDQELESEKLEIIINHYATKQQNKTEARAATERELIVARTNIRSYMEDVRKVCRRHFNQMNVFDIHKSWGKRATTRQKLKHLPDNAKDNGNPLFLLHSTKRMKQYGILEENDVSPVACVLAWLQGRSDGVSQTGTFTQDQITGFSSQFSVVSAPPPLMAPPTALAPPSVVPRASAPQIAAFVSSSAPQPVEETPQSSSGWMKRQDPTTKRTYYVNMISGESQWDPPAGF